LLGRLRNAASVSQQVSRMQVREHSVSVNRVEQSTPYYCGAACASMTFDKYGTTLL